MDAKLSPPGSICASVVADQLSWVQHVRDSHASSHQTACYSLDPIAVMEEYKAKYAIHEACREGQGSSNHFPPPHERSSDHCQHPASTLCLPPIQSSRTCAIPMTVFQYTGPYLTTTSRSYSRSSRQSRLIPTPQMAQAGPR